VSQPSQPDQPDQPPVSLVRPPALKQGDRVAVLCVSSPVEPAALAAGLDALRFAGLDPVIYPSARDPGSMRPYLAGDDAMRAGDLRSALTDPGIAGILFARGGSGAQRTLEAMDWDGLAPKTPKAPKAPKAPKSPKTPKSPRTGMPPKVLAGYSDVTAVLEAVAVRLGWASVFGPMVAIREGASHYSFGSLLRTLMRPEQATVIQYPQAVTVVPGLARGVTTGGTLCLLASSLGTGTSRPARGGILLLEDVNEEDYRIDRMLTQLRRSGYLDGVAGIVAGTFTGCGPQEPIHDILAERLGSLHVPMIAWANVGHGGLFQAFPYGIAAELDAGTATLRLLDPPLIQATNA
jgi:muramoyltetrapeptide carboxypeptidase